MNLGALFGSARKLALESSGEVLGSMGRAFKREASTGMEKMASAGGFAAGGVQGFYGRHWAGAVGGSFLSGAVIGGTAGAATGFAMPSEGRGRISTAFRRGIAGAVIGGGGAWGFTKLASNKALVPGM